MVDLAGPGSDFRGGGVTASMCFAYRRWRNSDPLAFASLHHLGPLAQARTGSSAGRLESNVTAHI